MSKHNENLTQEQQDALETMQGASAVIMGYLKGEQGRVAPSRFNKHIEELGYPKMKREELIDTYEKIKESEALESLYVMGYKRHLKLDDIPNFVAEVGDLREKDVFSQVTNFITDNERNLAYLREMRALQRSGAHMKMLMDDLKESMAKELMGMPRAKYMTTEAPSPRKGDRSLILAFSDWHVGFMSFDMRTGDYNFQRLNTSVNDIIDYTLQLVTEMDIKHVYVVHAGDFVEQVTMRNVSQAFDAEFNLSEQISKATRLVAEMLAKLSKHVHITYGQVSGNHDRMAANPKENIPNDSSAYVILEVLVMLQEDFGQLPNVTLIDNRKDIYEFTMEVAGKIIRVEHGDNDNRNGPKIPKHEKEQHIDYYITGHLHSSIITQENYHKTHVQVGSTVGENSFSKQINAPTTGPSQLIMILTEGSKSPMYHPLMLGKRGELV